jgi:recombination protein RecR
MFSPLIDELIQALCCLPGVGRKSAQRMTLQLLERDRQGALRLAQNLHKAIEKIGRCRRCRILTEDDICILCASTKRIASQLCVVETPADVLAIEQSGTYQGKYFVLLGHLSPIDGIGPEELGLSLLVERLTTETINELILATNTTVEGEATAHYIANKAGSIGIKVSRIAHGVPLGGELEYIDSGTLVHAFASRSLL